MGTAYKGPERRQKERRSPLDRRQLERRQHERRWRDAPFFIVERRKGPFWKYGSTAVAIALVVLWAVVAKM
jgi:hypothetical protein